MKNYPSKNIRNIALVGHGNAGKTSITEAMLFKAGAIDRIGKTSEGNTVSDFDPEEIKRVTSINTSLSYLEWNNCKINILDAPGLFDYVGGVHEAITAADSAVIVASGKSGISVGAIKAYDLACELNKAKMLIISKVDSKSADFYKVLNQAKEILGPSVTPVIVPYKDGDSIGFINVLTKQAYITKDGVSVKASIPDSENDRINEMFNALCENIAETDEELMEKYFSGEYFTEMEIINGLLTGVINGDITPVVACSALEFAGFDLLLDTICNILPSPMDASPMPATDKDGNATAVKCDEGAPLSAFVFKTVADQFGKLSFVKVITNKLTPNMEVYNPNTDSTEKIGKIVFMRGKKQEEATEIVTGDIAALLKISANTSDTLCNASNVVKFDAIKYPAPCYFMAVEAATSGDEGKISQGIAKLLDEDKTLSYKINAETHEQIIGGLGDQHLEVTAAKLKGKFGVAIKLVTPQIAYRETIRKPVTVRGKHKKQSGGHGQYGDVEIKFEPCDSTELVFAEEVFGGSVPKNYFPAVEKGLQESAKRGVLAGYPVVGLKATLLDGSYHPVDSSEMAFKMAASIAYKEGIAKASPCLLEPIGNLKVTVADSTTGDMMGELNKRRGRVNGMEPAKKGFTTIDADVPMSEMQDFTMGVRAMTQGMGSFTFDFVRYETIPANLEAAVIAASTKKEG